MHTEIAMRDRSQALLLGAIASIVLGLTDLSCPASRSSESLSAVALKSAKSIPTEEKFIDKAGNVAFEPGPNVTLGEQFSDGLLIVNSSEGRGINCNNGRTQYWNTEGELAFDAPFGDGFSSSEGLCPVSRQQEWGYADHTGKIVIPCTYFMVSPFHEGRAAVHMRDGWGFIDRTGSVVVKPQYKNCLPFSEGLAAVVVDKKIGFIDLNGKMIIPPTFSRARSFTEGLARVSTPKNEQPPAGGFIDKTGKTVIDFSALKSKALYCELLQPAFLSMDESTLEVEGLTLARGRSPNEDKDFHEGLLPLELEDGFGYINTDGKIAIGPKFKKAHRFSEGLAAVSDGKKYGFINKTGSYIIAPVYAIAKTFSEGLAAVSTDGKRFGFIDRHGTMVIPEKFMTVGMFHNERAKVEVEK
jgi:hypothetical protein